MKTCTVCNLTKPLDYFHVAARCKKGRKSQCIECIKRHIRTKDGLAQRIYATQKGSTKYRGYIPITYTVEEFKSWLFAQPTFNSLYEDWVLSGYAKEKIPSTDRLDDYSGYTLSGIRLTTWTINAKKGHVDKLNGINTKQCTAVDKLDLEGNFLERYHSFNEAARSIHKPKGSGNINNACNGKFLTAYKYKWRLSEIPNNNMETT